MKPEDCKATAVSPGESSIFGRGPLSGHLESLDFWAAVSSFGCPLLCQLFPSTWSLAAWQGLVASQERGYTQADAVLTAKRRKMQNRDLGSGSGVGGLMPRAAVSRILWAGYLAQQCSCCCSLSLLGVASSISYQVQEGTQSCSKALEYGCWVKGLVPVSQQSCVTPEHSLKPQVPSAQNTCPVGRSAPAKTTPEGLTFLYFCVGK